MEDSIPQWFKVQWINTTLRYIKDDNQLVMEYPEMPIHHVEYLHNLIWQRKNNVGLGFKSLYAPVWEAMKMYSLKYKFKISINKCEEGKKGYLVIEKVPKTDQVNKAPDISEMNLSGLMKDSEAISLYTAAIKDRNKPNKKTKGQKFFIDNKKIIDSISPALLKRALQKIMKFLTCEADASVTFSDLAPVEARFYENFLGIYNRRKDFQDALSTTCNNILDGMCEYFKEFDKQCKLEIYPAKYNVHTKTREVSFLKVPRYTRANAMELQKKQKPHELSPIRTESSQRGRSEEIDTPKATTSTEFQRQRVEKKSSNDNSKEKVTASSEVKLSMVSKSTDKTGTIHNEFQHSNKELVKIDVDAIASSFLSNGTTNRILPVKKTSTETELRVGTNSHLNNRVKGFYMRRDKLLQDMSTPLESDKAERMMRLMGWEGGALGLRGEGIVEPLIPALHILPGKGLGHVDSTNNTQPKQTQPNQTQPNQTQPKSKNTKDNTSKVTVRRAFLMTILSLIKKDVSVTSVTFSVNLSIRERRCFAQIIEMINMRKQFTLTASERVILKVIEVTMANDPKLTLGFEFSSGFTELMLTKSFHCSKEAKADRKQRRAQERATQQSVQTCDGKISNKYTQKEIKILICTKILEFLKSDCTVQVVRFEQELTEKFIGKVNRHCSFVNKRTLIPYGVVRSLAFEILANTKDCYLNVQFDPENKRSFTISKLYYQQQSVNVDVVHKVIDKYANNTENASQLHPTSNEEETKLDMDKSDIVNGCKDSYKDSVELESKELSSKVMEQEVKQKMATTVKKHNLKEVNNLSEFSKEKLLTENDTFKVLHNDLVQAPLCTKKINSNNTIYNNKDKNNHIKCIQLPILDDKLDVSCELVQCTSRKWYEHSESFLKCDALVNDTPRNTVDPNNNVARRGVEDVVDSQSDNKQCTNSDEDEQVVMKADESIDIDFEIKEHDDLIINTTEYNNSGSVGDIVESLNGKNKCTTDVIDLQGKAETSNFEIIHDTDIKDDYTVMCDIVNDETEHNHNGDIEDIVDTQSDKQCVSDVIQTQEKADNSKFKIIQDMGFKDDCVVKGCLVINNIEDITNINMPDKKCHCDVIETSNKAENSKLDIFHVGNSRGSHVKCYDIVLIDSRDMHDNDIHRTVQCLIEALLLDPKMKPLPLLKYHGVLKNGLVYSCHRQDTCLWLQRTLHEYRVVDYRTAIDNHRMKVSIASFNKSAKKILELLQLYNVGLKSRDWRIVYEKYDNDMLIFGVEMNRVCFEYVCDNNFSLFAGFDLAQFTIGC